MSSNIIEDHKDAKHDIVVREHEGQDYQVDDYGELRPEPTEEDWRTLREVADDIPKAAYLVILVEFCERFTYYGKTVVYTNNYCRMLTFCQMYRSDRSLPELYPEP